MKTNADKLKEAMRLLSEVNNNWNENEVVAYPKDLASFDEVVSLLNMIELSNKPVKGLHFNFHPIEKGDREAPWER